MKIKGFKLCLITDRSLYRCPLHEVAQNAEEDGIDFFQLRDKRLSPAALLKMARHIRPMLLRARMIINGHLDVALASEADGVHLQKDNLPVSEVKRRFPRMIVGYSAHTRDDLQTAQDMGADYVFLSPIFKPRSKLSTEAALGLSKACSWLSGIRIPVFALGGISSAQLLAVKDSGFAGAAAISMFVENGRYRYRSANV